MAELTFEQGLDALDRRAWLAQLSALPVLASTVVAALLVLLEVNGAWSSPYYDTLEMSLLDIASWIYLGSLTISMVFIGMWIHLAHTNLRTIGFGSQEFTPGWSVLWFFIPIASLWKPFQAMRELWRRSTNSGATDGREAPPLMLVWWSGWIIGSIVGFSDYWNYMDAIAYAGEAVAAVCIILIIRLITQAQQSLNIGRAFE